MKFLILSFFLFVIPFIANAQENPDRQLNETYYHQGNSNNEAMRMAGEHLIKHSRQYYLGWALIGGGYVFTGAAFANDNVGLAAAGAVSVLAGLVFQVISHRQIGKAGHLLKQASFSHNNHHDFRIQGSHTGAGIGLAYNF